VPELGIRERPPSTLGNVDSGPPLAGADGDPGVPTINVKKHQRQAPWPPWGFRSPSGIQKLSCDLHRYDRQKVILLTCPILPALSSVMADDPEPVYGAWVIQCDII
jgi:hypothetical protein